MITLDEESGMTRSEYKEILDQALQAEHGICLPYSDWNMAGRVRAQLYRLRDRLRYRKGCRDYDCLTFRLMEGNLCIIREEYVPPVDDEIKPVEPVALSEWEALGLPVYPRAGRRVPRR